MTPVDDLKPGMYVAVVDDRREQAAPALDPWSLFGATKQETSFDGRPLRILDVCLPFLCVTDGRKRFAIDVRQWSVRRVSRRYAQMMQAPEAEVAKKFGVKPRKRKEKPDKKACPRCHARMVERLIMGPAGSEWRLICNECRHDGGPVAKPE